MKLNGVVAHQIEFSTSLPLNKEEQSPLTKVGSDEGKVSTTCRRDKFNMEKSSIPNPGTEGKGKKKKKLTEGQKRRRNR
ncbi:hypothetical protein OUZ56_016610 [Daphnia magna]|uniref:Uncharacterized protein n=1 Tax=Daphnia magna TaxID=35525 RepID=A0ABR0ARG9_9CRUS|nr:hypothetical protein OUZ56_016610 [Daphnia magna]